MQIQINTDDKVEGPDALSRRLEAEISSTLSRFSERLTRVEVHLSDESAGKSGSADKRCLIEARPTGQQPVSVTEQAATVDQAFTGAVGKLKSLLESKFGQLDDRKGSASLRNADA